MYCSIPLHSYLNNYVVLFNLPSFPSYCLVLFQLSSFLVHLASSYVPFLFIPASTISCSVPSPFIPGPPIALFCSISHLFCSIKHSVIFYSSSFLPHQLRCPVPSPFIPGPPIALFCSITPPPIPDPLIPCSGQSLFIPSSAITLSFSISIFIPGPSSTLSCIIFLPVYLTIPGSWNYPCTCQTLLTIPSSHRSTVPSFKNHQCAAHVCTLFSSTANLRESYGSHV